MPFLKVFVQKGMFSTTRCSNSLPTFSLSCTLSTTLRGILSLSLSLSLSLCLWFDQPNDLSTSVRKPYFMYVQMVY